MKDLNDIWLRGKAAQDSLLHLAAYNAAVLGSASIQALRLGLNAPQRFWNAVARGTSRPAAPDRAPERD